MSIAESCLHTSGALPYTSRRSFLWRARPLRFDEHVCLGLNSVILPRGVGFDPSEMFAAGARHPRLPQHAVC
jgi:hypothetical protein